MAIDIQRGRSQRRPETPEFGHLAAQIGTRHIERTMGDINDAPQPEHQRQTDGAFHENPMENRWINLRIRSKFGVARRSAKLRLHQQACINNLVTFGTSFLCGGNRKPRNFLILIGRVSQVKPLLCKAGFYMIRCGRIFLHT